MNEEVETPVTSRRRLMRLPIALAFIPLVLVALCGIVLWYAVLRHPNPFPPTIHAAKYSLFYPRVLPPGFYIDKNSFEQTSAVTTYTIVYGGDKKLIFTMQPKPSNFNFEDFHKEGKRLNSPIGQAYAGAVNERTVVSIPTDNSWLLISVPSEIKTSDLQKVLSGLETVKL